MGSRAGGPPGRRLALVLGLGLSCGAAGAVLVGHPDPAAALREAPGVLAHPLWPLVAAVALAVWGPDRLPGWRGARGAGATQSPPAPAPAEPGRWARANGLAARALAVWLPAAVGAACALMVATWAPHYLTWPWWADLDLFAVAAQAWDAGILPYRDLIDFNFPGPVYVFWGLGRVFGWGRTGPVYALDAALVVGLVAALAGWSRRRFGTTLLGLTGALLFLGYYLGLDYTLVAQRDWHATLAVALGLMAAQAWPGRAGRLAAAAALATGPHAVVFLPAMASAVVEGAGPRARPGARRRGRCSSGARRSRRGSPWRSPRWSGPASRGTSSARCRSPVTAGFTTR